MIPQLTMKIWDGDGRERFTHKDMNRVFYNINTLSRACGVDGADFPTVREADQFDYNHAQAIEDIIGECADKLGLSLAVESVWGVGRSLSFVDFDRWESNTHEIYRKLGGIGDRIPAERRRLNYSAILFADNWTGAGPWTQTLTSPIVTADREIVAFVPHTATIAERHSEAMARLRVDSSGDRRISVTATGQKPRTNIPIRLALGGLDMHEIHTIPASGWTGTGPWYQNITLSNTVADAIVGVTESTTNAQAVAFAESGIAPSAVSGKTITLRAIYSKPTMDLVLGVMYDSSEVI